MYIVAVLQDLSICINGQPEKEKEKAIKFFDALRIPVSGKLISIASIWTFFTCSSWSSFSDGF